MKPGSYTSQCSLPRSKGSCNKYKSHDVVIERAKNDAINLLKGRINSYNPANSTFTSDIESLLLGTFLSAGTTLQYELIVLAVKTFLRILDGANIIELDKYKLELNANSNLEILMNKMQELRDKNTQPLG